MNNTVLYRGSRSGGGAFEYGNLIAYPNGHCQICIPEYSKTFFKVDVYPDSVSMSIGATDEAGSMIFGSVYVNGILSKGGDIVLVNGKHFGRVVWSNLKSAFCFDFSNVGLEKTYTPIAEFFPNVKIIGNQFAGTLESIKNHLSSPLLAPDNVSERVEAIMSILHKWGWYVGAQDIAIEIESIEKQNPK